MYKKYIASFTVVSLLSGCVTTGELRNEASKITAEASKSTSEAPFKTVTSFSNSVRCMDGLFLNYGIRDVSILLEDLEDQTKKVSVGTKDMMLTTTSDMTRRSRAIRFIAFGSDSRNATQFMERSESKAAFANLPQFGIRGSISQFDDNVAKASKDVGFGIGDWVTYGKSGSATSKIVAIDLTVMNLADFSIVPGVSSKNGVAIYSEGTGTDGEARYKKFGINYATSLSKSEGTSVAVRNLIELASVELMGKLTKVPYWKCLGVTTPDAEVKNEVEDWYEAMAANGTELFAWWQYQMYIRGTYAGEVNGVPNPEFAKALRDYKSAMGLKPDTDLNAEFMLAYLQADHAAATARYEAIKPKQAQAQAQAPAAAAHVAKISLKGGERKLKGGEKVELELSSNLPGYAHCYMMDDTKKILRIHPNRFSKNGYIGPEKTLAIPDTSKFSLVGNKQGQEEIVECYVAAKDLLGEVPSEIGRMDLTPISSVSSLSQIRTLFEKSSSTPIGVARYTIAPIPGN